MTLLTQDDIKKLLHNGLPENRNKDHWPVVKLCNCRSRSFWLLTEIDPTYQDDAFGLCDLGYGLPELGYFTISDLESINLGINSKVRRDNRFVPQFPMSVYALAAKRKGGVTDNKIALLDALETLRTEESNP